MKPIIDSVMPLAKASEALFTPNFGARFEWQRYMDVGANVPGAQKEDIGVWRLSARYKF